MSYEVFLKKRNVIMGFAMIWIMLYHMEQSFGNSLVDGFIGLGYAGSDIFFFLSGVGIWFSLEKSRDLKTYFKKRAIRIFPMWFCFIGFWIVPRLMWTDMTPLQAAANVIAIESFFDMHHAFNWYISFLLVFYLIAPVIKLLIEKLWRGMGAIIIMVVFFLLGYFWVDDPDIMIGISRVPIFTLGMTIGFRISRASSGEKKAFSMAELIFWPLMIPVGLGGAWYFGRDFAASWHNGMLWYPLIASTFGLCLVIALISEKAPGVHSQPFDFIGHHTLSIYLVHILVYEIYKKYIIGFGLTEAYGWHWLLIWTAVALGAFVLEKLSGWITKRMGI